jgi:cytochrome o ubiquinol oxidase operon protein cyoD
MQKDITSSVWQYVVGFVLAVSTTLIAYELVVTRAMTGNMLIAAIVALAVMQLVVQVVFFLHLGKGRNARWNISAFLFMLIVLVIIVGGSLWIMYNLNYNMTTMTPDQKNTYMKGQNGSGGF